MHYNAGVDDDEVIHEKLGDLNYVEFDEQVSNSDWNFIDKYLVRK